MLAGSSSLQTDDDITVTSKRTTSHATSPSTSSPFVHVVLLSLSLPWICVTLVAIAIVVRGGFTPGVDVLRVFAYKQEREI